MSSFSISFMNRIYLPLTLKNTHIIQLEDLGVGQCHDILTARASHAYAKGNPREV